MTECLWVLSARKKMTNPLLAEVARCVKGKICCRACFTRWKAEG